MRPSLVRAARDLFVDSDELWVLIDEHQVYGRIPDLVAARIDLAALEARFAGGWQRALNETELRALHSMRPDRGRSLRSWPRAGRRPRRRAAGYSPRRTGAGIRSSIVTLT